MQTLFGGFWFGGIGPTTSVGSPGPRVVGFTRIDPASPNPCHGLTTFSFSLAAPQIVRAELYNLSGEQVRTILAGPHPTGQLHAVWDGTNERGEPVPSGAYFIRFTVGDQERVQTIVVRR